MRSSLDFPQFVQRPVAEYLFNKLYVSPKDLQVPSEQYWPVEHGELFEHLAPAAVARRLELVLACQLLLASGDNWRLAAISKAAINMMTLTALILDY